MQEIFRGKRRDNGEWIEGSAIWFDDDQCFIMPLFPSASTLTYTEIFALTAKMVIPETVGQYTGLTDKNSKKIFEGDIVKNVTIPIQCGIGVVQFGNYEMPIQHSLINDDYSYHIGFYIEWNKTIKFYRNDLAFWNKQIEVIGNIHDNPELVGNSEQLEEIEE